MSVMTVNGPLAADSLGVVSPHEHLLIDIRNQFTEFTGIARRARSEGKVCLENMDALSRNPYAVKDNLVMDDVALAEQELLRFKLAGGDTVVDATLTAIGRDPDALLSLSRATGVNVVAGCGHYTADTHPANMAHKTVAEIREEILHDLRHGMDATRVRAGVIGEIGTSAQIDPGEKKVLEAAAEAQLETGVGVIVHTYPWGQCGLDALEILCGKGVPPQKVSINHIDVEIDLNYCRQLLRAGCSSSSMTSARNTSSTGAIADLPGGSSPGISSGSWQSRRCSPKDIWIRSWSRATCVSRRCCTATAAGGSITS